MRGHMHALGEHAVRVINYGSLNVDYVYRVPHFVRPGETLSSLSLNVFAGGKGANQSIALARAGAPVLHAGRIGEDGRWLLDTLRDAGVDVRFVRLGDGPSGHAIIQVDEAGENAIVLFSGENKAITRDEMEDVVAQAEAGDVLLLQNEINGVPFLIQAGHDRGMTVCLNPAPFAPPVLNYPLELVSILIVNQTEGASLTGQNTPDTILASLSDRFPNTEFVLTLGGDGVRFRSGTQDLALPAERAEAVDTTGAGDTFIGYFLAARVAGTSLPDSLALACKAAAICVSRPGAASSIPCREDVLAC